ncbi:MAG: hypothetical protein JOZ12_02575, partial [Sinobacteraceae bacterium]|nr:hypothetical protein [Nevskiaceae bacterium]
MHRIQQLTMTALLCVTSVTAVAHHSRHAVRVRTDEPNLRSTAALVVDTTHSSVLYSRRADVPAPIASITKLMTALVVADADQPLNER